MIHNPESILFAWAQEEDEGAAFGTGTKALCIKDNDALQKLSKYNVFYLPDGRIVDLKGEYKVSGFFTQEDAIESARGAIFSLKINGYDNKHAYSGTKSVGFGYKKNDETLALLAKVDDMSILETSDNVVRVFIDKTNKSIQVKSKADEILETISFNGECNCVYPEEGFETYFTSNNVSQSYIDYFNQRSQKIDNALHEDTEVINQLVEKVNADKDNNNKDEQLLGTKLADKLKTFELFNNRKFIVATLPINTLCTNQNTWNTIAKEVFEKAGLPADAILVTIPYVHCSGIGPDLGEYYFMPGIAFGSNAKIELSKLRTDYSNTQRVAEFATNQKFPVGEFIEDVFANTYKKAVVYRGIYNGSNAIEAVKYEKDNVTGLPFNKTIELYRQKEYTKLANVAKDWEAANKGLLDVYKTGALSAYDYANQVRFTDFEYRKEFAKVLAEVSQAGGLEKFTPNSDNLFIYKEEYIESTYGSNEDINAIHYIKNRAFKELQEELNYPYSDDFEYSATITLNRDFWTDHVDPVVYTTLDVTSVALGIIVPGADIFPESIGLFYSAARLNVERTAIYTVAVAIPTSMGNPIVVNKTFKQLGSNVFKIVRRETIEVTENAADDLLLDFVEAEYKKGKFSETDYLSLKAKKGEELKTAIDEVLSGGVKLADNLAGAVKSTFDELVEAGIRYVDDGSTIKFFDSKGDEIAVIADNKITPKKWTLQRRDGGELVSQTEAGYYLIKNGDEYAFELGYKEGRVLSADEVNAYHKGIGNHEPYKAGTIVNERSLEVGDKVYIVENAVDRLSQKTIPNPGGWGSKNMITTEKELREYLAVLEEWKKANGINDPLVVREYTVKSPLRVRDGVVGPQMDVLPDGSYKVYYGGEHQYEFIDFLGGNNWKNFLNVADEAGTILK